jgi:hypothetical protein
MATAVLFAISYSIEQPGLSRSPFHIRGIDESGDEGGIGEVIMSIVPPGLAGRVYNLTTDFVNPQGAIPPFWDCQYGSCQSDQVWGPCYAPHGKIRWEKEMQRFRQHRASYEISPVDRTSKNDFANLCRPGFLIIGAGKCGTSSLYHYLTDHPRVLPAIKKQIHYFKVRLKSLLNLVRSGSFVHVLTALHLLKYSTI